MCLTCPQEHWPNLNSQYSPYTPRSHAWGWDLARGHGVSTGCKDIDSSLQPSVPTWSARGKCAWISVWARTNSYAGELFSNLNFLHRNAIMRHHECLWIYFTHMCTYVHTQPPENEYESHWRVTFVLDRRCFLHTNVHYITYLSSYERSHFADIH